MKKGFTLIELLTVIIILGIVALIAFPFVNSTIERNKRKTFEASLNEAIKAAQMYMASEALTSNIVFTYNDERLAMEHNSFKQGTIEIRDGKIRIVNITDGEYCGSGTLGNLKIKKGDCTLNAGDYVDGTLLYYNPVTKETCSPTDVDYNYSFDMNTMFDSSGDSTPKDRYTYNGKKLNSCLRWYIFNYDAADRTYDAMLADSLFAEKVYSADAHEEYQNIFGEDEEPTSSNISKMYKFAMNIELKYLKSIWNTDVRLLTKSELEGFVGKSITRFDTPLISFFEDSNSSAPISLETIQSSVINLPSEYGWLAADKLGLGAHVDAMEFLLMGRGDVIGSGDEYGQFYSFFGQKFYGMGIPEIFEYKPVIKLSADVEPKTNISIEATLSAKLEDYPESETGPMPNIRPKINVSVSGAGDGSYYCVTPVSNFRSCIFPKNLGKSPIQYTSDDYPISAALFASGDTIEQLKQPVWKSLDGNNFTESVIAMMEDTTNGSISIPFPEYFVYVMTEDGEIGAPAVVSAWSENIAYGMINSMRSASSSSGSESGSGGESGSGNSNSIY